MKGGVVAGVLAALMAAPAWSAPQDWSSAGISAQNVERIESGSAPLANGRMMAYRIRLLPVSSFPDLPEAVAAEMNQRGCMIPQSFEAKQPENVIHGAFRAPGSSDWAALCSVHETTTLYVFFAGQASKPMALHSQADSAWLGAEPGSTVAGSAWGIAVSTASELRATPALHRGLAVDHDGIDDAQLEHSLVIHYFEAGRWIDLRSADGSNPGFGE
jgi:hypothetical protein